MVGVCHLYSAPLSVFCTLKPEGPFGASFRHRCSAYNSPLACRHPGASPPHLLASLLFKHSSHFPAPVCLCCPRCLQDSCPRYSTPLAPWCLRRAQPHRAICSTPTFSALFSLTSSPLNIVPPRPSALFVCLNCSVSSVRKS